MDRNQQIKIIETEQDLQKRLALLVKDGFKDLASGLIRDSIKMSTASFYYDWHGSNMCQPLPRVTEGNQAVYVVISSSTDFEKTNEKRDGSRIVFELGWERKALGWTEKESQDLVRSIVPHALARPLNQWSFRQAEGTARAVRDLLHSNDPVVREVAALHLVYQLRQADFGHICNYLADIEGFPCDTRKEPDAEEIVDWIVDQLLSLGWTEDRIRKELCEWIWLKTDTWPQWLLAVAKAKVFGKDDPTRAVAVRRWIMNGFDYLLDTVPRRDDSVELAGVYRELLKIGRFGPGPDIPWIREKLTETLSQGRVSPVKFFIEWFSDFIYFNLEVLIAAATFKAADAGRYGIAVVLARSQGQEPRSDWISIANARGLPTELS